MLLTPKIERAIKKASQLHDGQQRKVEHNLPYISHLFSVAAILSEYANNEDVLIAGLLHDTIEDTPYTLKELEDEFGSIAAKTVEQVTEVAFASKSKTSWKERKLAYLKKLETADARALMVATADKMHNLQTIIDDYRKHGAAVWKNFTVPPKEQIWFFNAVLEILERRLESAIVPAYRSIVEEAERLFIIG